MDIRRLTIKHFRGFDDVSLKPRGHVLLIGEPGSGRSDMIEAIARILDAEAARVRNPTELDFHGRDTTQPVEIEITIAHLGEDLEQYFFDQLELWDAENDSLLAEGQTKIDDERTEWILRLAYRAEWNVEQERGNEWIYYPKLSDPTASAFARLRAVDIEQLGFVRLGRTGNRVLDLGERGGFRRVVETMPGNDFADALRAYTEKTSEGAALLSQSEQVSAAVDSVLAPLVHLLGVTATDLQSVVQFSPEGGSGSGLLRSLAPSINLGGPEGRLPAVRRGSTFASLLRIGEAIATLIGSRRILAIDDLGEGLDPGSAIHLASVVRNLAAQVWMSTRDSSVGEIFDPAEVVRLGWPDGVRTPHQLPVLSGKDQRNALRQWHLNLLPALTYRSAVIFEGHHDLTSYRALAIRLCNEQGLPLPAAQRTVLLAGEGSSGGGGYAGAVKLAQLAKAMGIRGVAVVDGDTATAALTFLDTNKANVDALLRLPNDAAVEFAIVHGVASSTLKAALSEAALVRGIALPPELATLEDEALEVRAIDFIKGNALHAPTIDALPATELPTLLVLVLTAALKAARGDDSGFRQL